jgi:hypothetical protein
MLELIKDYVLTPIQVSAEVNAALKEHTLVVVVKEDTGQGGNTPVYKVFGCNGLVIDGQVVEN